MSHDYLKHFEAFFFSPQYLIISDHKVGNKDFIFWY